MLLTSNCCRCCRWRCWCCLEPVRGLTVLLLQPDVAEAVIEGVIGVSSSPSNEQPSLSCLTECMGMSPKLPMTLLAEVASVMLL
jgi:hypothetical protein